MDYTLQQLRYLVAVADHGSVSAAARSLYVSQPGLSSAILHLEEVFGIQCFIRHRAKGVSLTPAGHLFVKEARDVLFRASNLRHPFFSPGYLPNSTRPIPQSRCIFRTAIPIVCRHA